MKEKNKKNEHLEKAIETLNQGVIDVFSSEEYINYLRFCKSFHNYSYNNRIMIYQQRKNATFVAGFNDWNKKYKRHIKQGEKAIKIIAPMFFNRKIHQYELDNKGEKILDENGKPKTKTVDIQDVFFKVVNVFDVSQTEGEPLPLIDKKLTATVDNFQNLFSAISDCTDYSVSYADLSSLMANGLCDFSNKQILLQEGLAESQQIKTLIHEVAHSKLHYPTEENQLTKSEKEVQAESVAFLVSDYFGVDTSDYSFSYVANWSTEKSVDELKNSLKIITDTSKNLINDIEKRFDEIQQRQKNIQQINKKEKGIDRDSDGIDDSIDSSYTSKNINADKFNSNDFSKIIDEIKQIPIQEYASRIGYTPKKVGSYYTLAEHDSVRIDTEKNAFIQNSSGKKGSIIDFVMHFENVDTATAIKKLSSYIGTDFVFSNFRQEQTAEKEVQELILPEKNDHMKNVYAYLINTRKIDFDIVKKWANDGLLFQDKHNNCVFVTNDKDGKPVFASQRGTNTFKTFKADVKGSNYDVCHFINNNAKNLVVCEGVIDLMSIQTIFKDNGKNIDNYNYLSLNGVAKTNAITNALICSPTEKVILATDNDKAGLQARINLKEAINNINNNIEIVEFIPPNEKDWNAELVAKINQAEKEEKEKPLSLQVMKEQATATADKLNKEREAEKTEKSLFKNTQKGSELDV